MDNDVGPPTSEANSPGRSEPRWPGAVAVLGMLALHLTLPEPLTLMPSWVLPTLLVALLVALLVGSPHRHPGTRGWQRTLSLALLAGLALAHVTSLVLLVRLLLDGGDIAGAALIRSAISLWLTNVVVFGIGYWELDGGGPEVRLRAAFRPADFLFPQATVRGDLFSHWRPQFVDYFYVALTNGTAFSPTDTLPLTPRAKLLMGLQSSVALITVALIAGRAVNVLS
jgi:hypothetical protein